MVTDIFIKTYAKDAEYHQYCMASYRKFCTGFGRVVTVESEHPQGYLEQQVCKMEADLYCPGADFILVTDSDTLFTEQVTPESFMRDGKPIWYQTPLSSISGDARCWIPVMEAFHGVAPEFEFMRRQPFMFPAWILEDLRTYCIRRHGRSLDDYIMGGERFSEWNVLGMHAWLNHRDSFSWINTEEELPPAKCHQAWSHDPIEKNLERFKEILA
jgi:hypothetical protein